MNRLIPRRVAVLSVTLALAAVRAAPAELAVTSGDRIVFLGDSITKFGMGPAGWVTLVMDGLKRAGVEAQSRGAGIPGDRSNDMLARLPRLLATKPTWLVVNCGVNDVFRGVQGVPLDAYRANMFQIVMRAHAAGVRVLLVTATMIGEDPATPNNRTLQQYDAAVRQLAHDQQCLLADVGADMQRQLAALEQAGRQRGNLLTEWGAHLNAPGSIMMAESVLRAFRVPDAVLARAKEAWLDIPGSARIIANVPLTARQLDALEARAAERHTTVERLLQPVLDRSVADFLAR